MKNLSLIVLMIGLSLFFFTSCEKEEATLNDHLIGTWNVVEVQATVYLFGIPLSDTDQDPTGTMTFNDTGWATQDYSFSILDSMYTQTGSFTWRPDGDQVFVNENFSNPLIWNRSINEANMQKATYSDTISINDIREFTLTFTR